jgi:hypothetical protein
MLHQYLTDELAAHEVVGNRLCLKKKIHPKKLLEL